MPIDQLQWEEGMDDKLTALPRPLGMKKRNRSQRFQH